MGAKRAAAKRIDLNTDQLDVELLDTMTQFAICCDDCCHEWKIFSPSADRDAIFETGAEIAGFTCPDCDSPRYHATRLPRKKRG